MRQKDDQQDERDLNNELRWAASRPGSRWADAERLPTIAEDGTGAFEDCLTSWEAKAFNGYMRMFPDSAYALNQSPWFRPICAKGEASQMKSHQVM